MAMTPEALKAAIVASILSSKADPDLNILNNHDVMAGINEIMQHSDPLINAVNAFWAAPVPPPK